MMNRNMAKVSPWRTPTVMVKALLRLPRRIQLELFVYIAVIGQVILRGIPQCLSILNKPFLSTDSNALLKCTNVAGTGN